jgi:nucleotide-binding universal stress UspA family protein
MSTSLERTHGPVIVGVDGSDNARRALETAAQIASALGTSVVAVHALGLLAVIDGNKVPAAEHRDELEDHLRARWCAPLDETLSGRWSAELIDGSPSLALLTAVADHQASFVVVGARGVGGHPDLMLGSTSHQVIQHAACPAIVVPPVDRGTALEAADALRQSL